MKHLLTITLLASSLSVIAQSKPIPRDTTAYNKTWQITDSIHRKGKIEYFCKSGNRTTWLIKHK